MKDDSFKVYVMEQLEGMEHLHCRAMFGGHGLYLDGRFFAILYRGQLYFKTDAQSRGDYLAAGSEPFQPSPGQTLGTFYEVPVAVLESSSILLAWAARAATINA